jgi:hypothetical protein
MGVTRASSVDSRRLRGVITTTGTTTAHAPIRRPRRRLNAITIFYPSRHTTRHRDRALDSTGMSDKKSRAARASRTAVMLL